MVLIPKGKKEYREIGLVEVMWKVVAAILNCRLTASIAFHDFLHGFLAVCGTGTATLEAKLLQQLAALREEVLYVIFLNLNKEYDALERSMCLGIMEGYGVGPQACRILKTYWSRLRMVISEGGHCRAVFTGAWGVTQGDPLSPTIFNVAMDAVMCHWVSVLLEVTGERGGHGKEGSHQNDLLYADNNMVVSSDPRCQTGRPRF